MGHLHHTPIPPGTGGLAEAIMTLRASDPHFARNPGLLALRRALADRIETDIATLDLLGGDPDFEPSLGAPNPFTRGPALDWVYGSGDDREEDHDGREPDEDHEPSLGSLGGTSLCEHVPQTAWACGNRDEREDDPADGPEGDDEREPSLCGLTVDHPSGDGDDREDGDDNGIADVDGRYEQGKRYLSRGGDFAKAAVYIRGWR